MGINIGTVTFLTKSNLINTIKKNSIDKTCKTLMQGRQWMSTTKDDFHKVKSYNSQLRASSLEKGCFAEDFLTDLGTTSIDSLDFSDFESATIIHNLNQPLKGSKLEQFKSSYDLVLDYGTSEHVFQPAQSIATSISLLKVGGYFNCTLPISGWLEHGFFQFSPTFFLAMDRGSLQLERMYIYQPYTDNLEIWDARNLPNCPYYDRIEGRLSCWAVYKKVSEFDEKDFLFNTQQGVYKKAWDEHEEKNISNSKNNNTSELFKFKDNLIKKSRLIQKWYMKSKRIKPEQIPVF